MFRNSATLHTSNIKTLVHLHKDRFVYRELNPHDHSSCISAKQHSDSSFTLQAQSIKRHEWKVDRYCVDPNPLYFDEERRTLIDLVLKGHNAASLFTEVGGSFATYKTKQAQKKSILDSLSNGLDTGNTRIEFAFFGFTDTYCYDLRKNATCSCSKLIERGIDYWMKHVNSIDEIWSLVSKGSKIPSVLKIKLSNSNTKRFGCFFIFDLLEPQFQELFSGLPPSDIGISNGFVNLRFLIEVVSGIEAEDEDIRPGDPVITDFYVLTHLLANFICSQSQLVVFAHLPQCLKYHKKESLMTLDMLAAMRRIKVVSLANGFTTNEDGTYDKCRFDQLQKKLYDAQKDNLQTGALITTLTHKCNELVKALKYNTEEKNNLLAQQEQKRHQEVAKLSSESHHKRSLLIKQNRSIMEKLKHMTISSLAAMKKQMTTIKEERNDFKKRCDESEKMTKQLKTKHAKLIESWKKKENEFIREANILRAERQEFIEMFHTLQDALIEKKIDLNK